MPAHDVTDRIINSEGIQQLCYKPWVRYFILFDIMTWHSVKKGIHSVQIQLCKTRKQQLETNQGVSPPTRSAGNLHPVGQLPHLKWPFQYPLSGPLYFP